MRTVEQRLKIIDYRQEKASNAFVPQPAVLSSLGWDGIHFELHQQPKFEVAEHQHTMHVIAAGISDLSSSYSSGERWLDGKLIKERRNSGDIAIIPEGIAHRCNWNTPAQFMILAFDAALLKQVGEDLVNCDRIQLIPHFMSRQDELIQGICWALKAELESGKMGGYLLIDSLKTTLAIHLLRNYCTTQPKLSTYTDGLSQFKLQQLKEYIKEHLHQEIKLSEIAAIAQMSQYHFLRLFKQSMGVTPHQYILQCRINRATYLLQYSQLSIADIAMRVGFCDQSHLTRYFKRVVGVTPKQFMESGGKLHPL
ncbi:MULTISPECIES: helix-turn-helix transcriptional regulator [unclassified Tolypothrix]|uniref:helix-turn-helix transcriptional regulator n=1 Tax=unclassified Tolypothrix TaxID=2649714 RepID=UPI0005EAAE86|nr:MULTISPECIES: AraC family transcriptional regulator [unclassified Tolypothrix]BAY90804.1 AraC family transcriptional regulator [Microchaete diplosiphon NIES-3275]EKF04346.1 AraC family transcriptional regulator [Tolypothrix sp. PCC 7601]MBE9087758.1 helix-turn-helix transcriptional regulator [Tolypothrix sp. LEGE 11397]UYD24936.1 helix-turn-helix transcriptional regulator [Tolypothrix sp. PCC 7712]UYD32831.1 helix-turn-helix transcriptional regulator [Tolypothrix sp. PCC 7601]